MRFAFTIIASLILLTASAQLPAWYLAQRIDSLAAEDQKWREVFRKADNNEIDSVSTGYALTMMEKTDSLHYIQVKQIFEKYGYPGYDVVSSTTTCHNFWLLVQHMDKHPDFQQKVLDQMKVQVEKGNASASDYAYLVDRVRVNTGRLQVYGTQMILNADSTSYIPKPVESPDSLDTRRASMKLSSIEEYTRMMNEKHPGALKKKQ